MYTRLIQFWSNFHPTRLLIFWPIELNFPPYTNIKPYTFIRQVRAVILGRDLIKSTFTLKWMDHEYFASGGSKMLKWLWNLRNSVGILSEKAKYAPESTKYSCSNQFCGDSRHWKTRKTNNGFYYHFDLSKTAEFNSSHCIDLIQHQNCEIRFTAVSPIKHLDFDLKNWWTFKERTVIAARAFKDWKSLRNKVVLSVKRISYFLHFSALYEVYYFVDNFKGT